MAAILIQDQYQNKIFQMLLVLDHPTRHSSFTQILRCYHLQNLPQYTKIHSLSSQSLDDLNFFYRQSIIPQILQMLTDSQENPLLGIFEEGVEQFIKYQKQTGESYKSRQQKTKQRYQKLTTIIHNSEFRKQRRRQQRLVEKKKLHQVIDTMTEQQAKAFVDAKKQQKKNLKEKVRAFMGVGQMMILDLVYEDKMNQKENKSLGKQIQLIMRAIKFAEEPPSVHVCNFQGGVKSLMEKMSYQHWAVTVHEEDLSIFRKTLQNKRLIYLSPDAQEQLLQVQQDDVFILGGLIDRTVIKNASLNRASQLGIQARRLPIRQYMKGRLCLNLDHVVSMLYKFKETKDWKSAFDYAAPKRWKKQQNQKQQKKGQEKCQQQQVQQTNTSQHIQQTHKKVYQSSLSTVVE